MKYVLAFTALLALLGFVGVTHAAEKASKPHVGHFVKADATSVTYKGGKKGTGKEHTVKIDDKTKVTLDGKDAKITDIKADTYVEITVVDDVATVIAASSTTPDSSKTSSNSNSK